jgi:hypothetical protein
MIRNVSVTFSEYRDAREAIGAAYSALFARRVRQVGHPLFETDWTDDMKMFDRLYDRLERLAIGWPLSDVDVAIGGSEIESCVGALFAGAEALEADARARLDAAALQQAGLARRFAIALQAKIPPDVATDHDDTQVVPR